MIKILHFIRKKVVQEGKVVRNLNFAIGKTQLIVIAILNRFNINYRHNNHNKNKRDKMNLKNLIRDHKEQWSLIALQL